jgi:hypothetical protein
VSARLEPRSDHVIEPVEGWRSWELERDDEGLRLVSPLVEVGWPAGVPLEAACRRHAAHDVPDPECSCGIYAVVSPDALGTVRGGVSVVGSIALWGRVVEHDRGYRGQLAYPQRLRLVCTVCLERDGTFRPPVGVVSSGERLRTVCAFHAWSVTSVDAGVQVAPAAVVEAELLSRYQVDVLPADSLPHHAMHETRVRSRRRRFRVDPRGDLRAFLRAAVVWGLLVSVLSGVGGTRDALLALGPIPRATPSTVVEDRASGVQPERRMPSKRPVDIALPNLHRICGRGPRHAIAVADCRTPGVTWMSFETLRRGIDAECASGDLAEALPGGRTRCWVHVARSS